MEFYSFTKKQQSKIPQVVTDHTKKIEQSGYDVFLVGGAIRDILLGYTPKDYDLFTNYPKAGLRKGIKLLGNNSTIQIDYIFRRIQPPISFTQLVFEAQFLNLTINKLMYSLSHNLIIDFFGGYKDLQNRKVKIPKKYNSSKSNTQVILRAIELSCKRNLPIDNQTYKMLKKNELLLIPAKKFFFTRTIKILTKTQVRSVFFKCIFYDWKLGEYFFPVVYQFLKRDKKREIFQLLKTLDKHSPQNIDLCRGFACLLFPIFNERVHLVKKPSEIKQISNHLVEQFFFQFKVPISIQRIISSMIRSVFIFNAIKKNPYHPYSKDPYLDCAYEFYLLLVQANLTQSKRGFPFDSSLKLDS